MRHDVIAGRLLARRKIAMYRKISMLPKPLCEPMAKCSDGFKRRGCWTEIPIHGNIAMSYD
jgi:hypothetical protein